MMAAPGGLVGLIVMVLVGAGAARAEGKPPRTGTVAPASRAPRAPRVSRPGSGRPIGKPFKDIARGYEKARLRPPEATATGFRFDRTYKDPAMVEALLAAYHARFPELTELVELGRTPGGRAIWALKISDHAARSEADEPAVLLNGAHHGNELMPVENVLDAVQGLLEGYARDPEVRRWVDGLEIWCVPLVNPDGNWAYWQLSHQAGRKNARDTNGNGVADVNDGVDLNRNYPFRWGALGERGSKSSPESVYYRGPHPASEPEVRALMRLSDSEHFAASLSYHTLANALLVPYTTDHVANPEPNEAWGIAAAIAAALPPQPNGKRMRVIKNLYPVDGVDQDHFRAKQGTVALLVEGPFQNPMGASQRQQILGTMRGIWRGILARILVGPAIGGHVRDAGGTPITAEVTVRELAPKSGEVWTARCRDGRFDRLVPGAGTYTLDIRAPGFQSVVQTVRVGAERAADLDIRLVPVAMAESATSGASNGVGGIFAAVCGDPALLSIDAVCACGDGAGVGAGRSCVAPGAARWCRIDGVCVRAGDRSGGGCGVCAPEVDPSAWITAGCGPR